MRKRYIISHNSIFIKHTGVTLSFKSDIRQRVEYVCNRCNKSRILFVAPSLQSDKVASHGYIEYVDVHYCLNDKLNAIKLFVDKNYAVRSQVSIKTSSSSDESSFNEIAGLNIPLPKKAEFINQKIESTRDYGAYNLKKLDIKDKLRERIYQIGGEGEGTEVEVKSTLNFIEIKATIEESISRENAEGWLKNLANMLESVVSLDETLLQYLGTYLDHMILDKHTEKELLELDLLLHSTVAIPHSPLSHINIFDDHVTELFPELSVVSFRMYKSIMHACLNNEQKTIIDISDEVKDKHISIQALPYFISILGQLVSFGFINIEKLEFYTI